MKNNVVITDGHISVVKVCRVSRGSTTCETNGVTSTFTVYAANPDDDVVFGLHSEKKRDIKGQTITKTRIW